MGEKHMPLRKVMRPFRQPRFAFRAVFAQVDEARLIHHVSSHLIFADHTQNRDAWLRAAGRVGGLYGPA